MPDNTFTVCVIGLGYIGLPTATTFAAHGTRVIGVDIDPAIVETVNAGRIHIVEPGLEDAVRKAVETGLLSASTSPEPADAFVIAVPTPFKGAERDPDLRFVEAAARAICPVLKKGDLVVLESTSPVGATEAMTGWMQEERPDLTFPALGGEAADIRVAYCPERVLPGNVMAELVSNDRVIGGMSSQCADAAVALYARFVIGEAVRATSPRVAELTKLTENSFRDTNIAFANELSLICDRLAISPWELIRLANRHPRVNILQPGPGVGGHCIAVDPWFIVSSAPEEARLIATARAVNDAKPEWVLDKVEAALAAFAAESGKRTPPRLACYGLSFKPDIDDLRESPALEIARELANRHEGEVLVVEPNIAELPRGLGNARLVDFNVAQDTADVHVLLVDHAAFRNRRPAGTHIVDTRGIWTD